MAQLSIIVTSYNIENYIGECLDAVLAQTLQDIEVIVVDDGSTDSSPSIIEDYAKKDDRIVPVILGENSPGGVATAANAGLDRATAPYIGFADGDDLFEPDMFETLLEAATRYDADLAMCNYRNFADNDDAREAPADEHRWARLSEPYYSLDDGLRHEFLRFVAVPWRKIYRRDWLEQHAIRFPVGDYFFEDNPFHWFSIINASSIAVVPRVLCYHRVARIGQTMSTVDERLFKIFQHHETIYNFLAANGTLNEFKATLLGWAISQMEWISRKTPPNLHEKLYEALQPVFAHYTHADLGQAIAEGGKGNYARQLGTALMRSSYPRFKQALEGNSTSQGTLQRAFYHLRHSGPRKTASIAAKFISQKTQGKPITSQLKSITGSKPGSSPVSNEHLLFALMSLEQRLDRIEEEMQQRSE